MTYSVEQFKTDLGNLKPRPFDTFILPPFIMWYAVKSKAMRKNARRMLFVGGVLMLIRNIGEYKRYAAMLTRGVEPVAPPV